MNSESLTRAERQRSNSALLRRRSKFLKRALRFAKRRIPVFSVTANGKTPLTRNGFKDATTDARQIQRWAKKFPNANIGIPTGGASGFVVIDLDRKPGIDGVLAFAELCRSMGIKIPDTYRIRTPRGGEHLYFRTKHAGNIRNSAGLLGPGIDSRGEGGYVNTEGSSIDGAFYECIGGSMDAVKPLPKPLRLKLLEGRRHSNGNGHVVYSQGQRNDSTFREACALRETGRSMQDALDLIRRLNLSACKPPLDDEELKAIVGSAYTYQRGTGLVTPPEEALTDMGNARRFALANEGQAAFVHELGEWYFRDEGGHWRRREGREYSLAKTVARQLQKQVTKIKDDLKKQDALSRFAIKSQSKGSIEACLKLAQSEPEISASLSRFDSKPYLLPVKNGVIDLQNGSFRPATASDYFLNVCPTVYDAAAECPNWRAFVELVQPSTSTR